MASRWSTVSTEARQARAHSKCFSFQRTSQIACSRPVEIAGGRRSTPAWLVSRRNLQVVNTFQEGPGKAGLRHRRKSLRASAGEKITVLGNLRLQERDVDILSLLVPALGSVFLDPAMQVIDTGKVSFHWQVISNRLLLKTF